MKRAAFFLILIALAVFAFGCSGGSGDSGGGGLTLSDDIMNKLTGMSLTTDNGEKWKVEKIDAGGVVSLVAMDRSGKVTGRPQGQVTLQEGVITITVTLGDGRNVVVSGRIDNSGRLTGLSLSINGSQVVVSAAFSGGGSAAPGEKPVVGAPVSQPPADQDSGGGTVAEPGFATGPSFMAENVGIWCPKTNDYVYSEMGFSDDSYGYVKASAHCVSHISLDVGQMRDGYQVYILPGPDGCSEGMPAIPAEDEGGAAPMPVQIGNEVTPPQGKMMSAAEHTIPTCNFIWKLNFKPNELKVSCGNLSQGLKVIEYQKLASGDKCP